MFEQSQNPSEMPEKKEEGMKVEGPKQVTDEMVRQLRESGFQGTDEEAREEVARRIRQGTKEEAA